MCGITGWVAYRRDLVAEQATVEAMTETMACRGPDAHGTWWAPHVALGHRRLAVIDLEGGEQPMTVDVPAPGGATTTVGMVYSGEAYNYLELKDELRSRGHRFATDSDTEVVLHAYLEWGEAFTERLNGMYAFAIWDPREDKLVMVRDRMGIKPFFYYPTDDGVLFGSEPKAILANPLARAAVDDNGLRELLTLSKTPGHSLWAGMFEVAPGTVVTVDRNGVRKSTYWRLETRAHTDDQDSSVAHVRELLDDITRRQLVADVPRCVLLSGGLDSSAITGLAAEQLAVDGEKVRSFAVDFAGQAENFVASELRSTPDTPYVHDVADLVKSQHSDIVLDNATLTDPDVRRTVVRANDAPLAGDLFSSLYLLFKAIREQSTVALSGESADELFGGYLWFHDPEVQRAETFPWLAFRGFRGRPGGVLRDDLLRRLDLPSYVRDRYADAVGEIERLDGESDHEWTMRKICYLHLTRMVRMLLDRKDRMSMAVGLEVRVPFCDHRLVEYVYNTPWSLKTFDGQEKSLLRAATRNVLPESVATRTKSPYPQTQDPAYVVALSEQARQLLADDHPVLELADRAKVDQTLTAEPGAVPRQNLEQLLSLATWLDIYRPEIRAA
ncbi:asparagine synthase (glutamine-hydrolyzing) [Kribbella sp. ALI-6-A]|uniref:asparagine synthase (glutamine-hydrolyzing) n=1 Tax=Kribbella sp. ALI-6-A TaxID=1933817 RepID=UPI00097C211C|nr:asparagine synthase (glutamine-hydrolyzing) [Kribbella sp. ALI-6-A]ONI67370.1 asparagine synthase (glutamine-hydrolyzing) [Kribbella sp. ALI-6-A]